MRGESGHCATPRADPPLGACLDQSWYAPYGRTSRMPTILVVDDSKVMRDMIVACLRAISGMNFVQASSGLEAIERLSLGQFDVMVLDVNMPDVGGVEVLEFLRAQDKLRSLPVLIVTTRGDDESRERVMRAGATAFLAKPFTPDSIIAEVRALLPQAAGPGA